MRVTIVKRVSAERDSAECWMIVEDCKMGGADDLSRKMENKSGRAMVDGG